MLELGPEETSWGEEAGEVRAACTCFITIEERTVSVLVDTGSMVTIVRAATLEGARRQRQERAPRTGLRSATGHRIQVTREEYLTYNIGGKELRHWTYVCPDLLHDAILGYDFIKAHQITIDGSKQLIWCAGSAGVRLNGTSQTMEVRICTDSRKPMTWTPEESFEVQDGRFSIKDNEVAPTGAPGHRTLDARPPGTCNGDQSRSTARSRKKEPTGNNNPTGRNPNWSQLDQDDPGSVSGTRERETPQWSAEEIQTGTLSPQEREELLELVRTHSSCFSWDGSLGHCTLLEHRIELTTDKPVRRPAYRTAQKDKEIIEKEVRGMLKKGVIEPSVSAYAAGVVLVPKPNNETRFCVDYRGLNQITKPDHYPLPLTRQDIFDTMGEARIFSCLDCQQGYWQVKMAEEDRHKTAFRCHLGLFQFKKIAFGLRNAPASYQRLMSHILSGYIGKFCHVFIDDIICYSRTFNEHLEHLRLIFIRLERADIKLKPTKCHFAMAEVKYLGHIISPGQIRPDPGNVQNIKDLPPPHSVRGVRALLGMASYYRSFVPDFSRRAQPLTELTKKNVPFQWGPAQQASFEDLKTALTNEPVLALPDFTKPFILMTDGSSAGFGAVLGQHHGDAKERVVAYASRKAGPLERSYSASELECLALVWATKHFREYLIGRTTEVVTDHWALKWLLNLTNASPRLQRWRLALLEYDLKITHKEGRHHRNADFLSRIQENFSVPAGSEGENDLSLQAKVTAEDHGHADPTSGEEVMPNRTRTAKKTGGTGNVEDGDPTSEEQQDSRLYEILEESLFSKGPGAARVRGTEKTEAGRALLKEWQREDKDCNYLRRVITEGAPEKSWSRDHAFRLAADGVLEEVSSDIAGDVQYKSVLPERLVGLAVKDAHAGHLGTKKTLGKLRASYFFKHMYAVCYKYVRGCSTCQKKDRGPKTPAPLGRMPAALGAWHTVAVDVLGPLPETRSGKRCIVVMTDYLTKYVLAVATKNQTAETTAAVLMDKFLEYGLPERLISDNGANFRSRLVQELCRLLKVSQLFTTPYHPQFDGLCERFNRTLAAMLRGFVAENQRDWDTYLPYVLHAYRAAPQESTGESPFFLMFFRQSKAPLDIMLSDSGSEIPGERELCRPEVKTQAINFLQERLHEAFKVVRQRLAKARDDQKRYHDKKSKRREFQVGDEVFLLNERVATGETKKLHRPWQPGYRIVKVVGPLNYLVQHPDNRAKTLRVHVNRLKASVPQHVWPDDFTYLKDIEKHRKDGPARHLEEWLAHEKCRYKPFQPEDRWSDASDEPSETDEGRQEDARRAQTTPKHTELEETAPPVRKRGRPPGKTSKRSANEEGEVRRSNRLRDRCSSPLESRCDETQSQVPGDRRECPIRRSNRLLGKCNAFR